MATGLSDVRRRIARAAERAGRDPGEITLVGVSKYASDEAVLAAHEEGLGDFAENRANEFVARSRLVTAHWHFVGRLQGNKVRLVRPIAYLLHSLDRPELAEYWMKGPGSPPPALVQVDLAREPQKGGIESEQAASLVALAEGLGVAVVGLMTVPPVAEDAEASRPWFRSLRELRDRIRESHPAVAHLSMGMTNDFEVAVEEGATVLRVGRAILGPSRHEG
jgi:hypothetical protein